MTHFGALAAASSRYAALYGPTPDHKNLPWYWGRMHTSSIAQDRPSPTGEKNYKKKFFDSFA